MAGRLVRTRAGASDAAALCRLPCARGLTRASSAGDLARRPAPWAPRKPSCAVRPPTCGAHRRPWGSSSRASMPSGRRPAATRRRRRRVHGRRPRGDRRQVERLERRREALGRVNPLAKEEYEAEKERLEELATQRADLEQSLVGSLEKLAAELTETVERRFTETFDAVQGTSRRSPATLFPGGEGKPASHRPEGGGRLSRDRGRAAARRQARAAAVAPLRRREGARRDRVPVRAVPRAAVPVLSARRGRGRARRHEHRSLRRAAAPLLRPRAVRRHHAPEADDGSGRRPLRRDDGRRRRLAGRVRASCATRSRVSVSANTPISWADDSWAPRTRRERAQDEPTARASSRACATRSGRAVAPSPRRSRARRSTRATRQPGSGSKRR